MSHLAKCQIRRKNTSMMRLIFWASTFLRKNIIEVHHLGWLQLLSLFHMMMMMMIFLRWR
uniref:Uncharacterized protein n=1 Tax=Arundo donax TaxID=35708 RepID=A0A0A9GQP1_ARUDO